MAQYEYITISELLLLMLLSLKENWLKSQYPSH